MTLLQLKYLAEIAAAGSINKAAKNLFISQSALSAALRELEAEFGITIFTRTNKGVVFTEGGRTFYSLCQPIIEQKARIEKAYSPENKGPSASLNVSTQHYPFCAQAFIRFLETVSAPCYDLRLKETNAYAVIEDVSSEKSDIGIIFTSNSTERFIMKVLDAHRLTFRLLHTVTPHALVRVGHPLTKSGEIEVSALSEYPYVSFDQPPGVAPHFSEEVTLSDMLPSVKNIYVNDRQTAFSVITHTDAFSIGSGLLPEGFSDHTVTSVAISNTAEKMRIGYIVKTDNKPEPTTEKFIEILADCITNAAK